MVVRVFRIIVDSLVWGALAGLSVSAQVTNPPLPVPATPSMTVAISTPSLAPNPVEQFRRLLSLPPDERDRNLLAKPEEKRKSLELKIKEYAALPVAEREARLRVLELRFYLEPLMRTQPANRAAHLAAIPQAYHKLVEDRLAEWDLLPPPLQQEVLETQTARDYFVRLEGATPAQRLALWQGFSLERRKEMEDRLARWRALPTEQRQRMYSMFDHFFELKEAEQEKTLNVLPEVERRQSEQVVDTYQNVPRRQRRQYIAAFRQFANMTPEQRAQFLHNAERWRALTPIERQTWREMDNALPPLPPGFTPQIVPSGPPK